MTISVLLPDLISGETYDPELAAGLSEAGAEDLPSGYMEASVASIFPDFPALVANHPEGVHYHESIRHHFPNDFSEPAKRTKTDRCMALSFGPGSPILVVCLLTVSYNILSNPPVQ